MWFYCHWFPEMQGLPILFFFFCRFQIFCISLLLISNSSALWGLFSSGLSLCDDFRKKNGFLVTLHFWTYQSSALTRRQLRGQSPLFVSMVFRLVVLFIINNSQSRSWTCWPPPPTPPPPRTCWARQIKSVNGFVFFRLSYFDYSDLQLLAIFIFEVDFSVTYFMTSAENSVWEPPNPLGRIPPGPLTRFWWYWPPVTKNLATALIAQVGLLRADSQRFTTH